MLCNRPKSGESYCYVSDLWLLVKVVERRAGKSTADDDAEQMAKGLNSRIRLPYLHTPAYPGCCGVHSSARSWITTSIKRGRISKARDGKLSLNPQLSFGEDDPPQLPSNSGSCTFHLKLTDHSIVMLCDAFHTNDFNPVNRRWRSVLSGYLDILVFTPLCRPWYTDAILHQGLPVKSPWLQDTQKDIRLQDD
ncbi:predicted protein [Histoplasma capsulatum G186AR]|uniref:Uncharacterized protein n=1 Tax=Ajellomyces capsulatus (strain G186AR / H82 / ATCC MYA-2454 / RMSCC 2432) TaxID=447093 RepID=C0NDX1_AJECG|nr:uncharacterized protein HCBG_02064 [Histoplasma capsulatum G186AR]EEH10419.1 predicted protein [Histoplasma capsulatum G186AR]